MTQDKQLKRKARELAARTGQSYQSALYELDPDRAGAAQDRPPAIFSPTVDDGLALPWDRLIEHLDTAEADLDHPDPYARAAAHDARARLHIQLYAQTTHPVYAAACARASVCDDISAARVRFAHGIPTIKPRSEAELVGLRRCAWCARPWQADPTGACEHCPRLLFGPTPTSRADAERMPPPQDAGPVGEQPDPLDVAAAPSDRHASTTGTGEPSPRRDVGPYQSQEQARAQVAASTFGIPAALAAPGFAAELVLTEALMMGGVQVSGWEDIQRQEIIQRLDPETAQVIAGWVLRAHLAGRAVKPSQRQAPLRDDVMERVNRSLGYVPRVCPECKAAVDTRHLDGCSGQFSEEWVGERERTVSASDVHDHVWQTGPDGDQTCSCGDFRAVDWNA